MIMFCTFFIMMFFIKFAPEVMIVSFSFSLFSILSARYLPVCHCLTLLQVQKTSNCHQSLERNNQSPSTPPFSLDQTQTLCMSLTFFHISLSLYMTLHLFTIGKYGGLASFQHHLSGTAGFNQVPPLGPYVHVHICTRAHLGGCFLAQRSVEQVIESLDQNISGAVKRPALAVVTALFLSIRLGWTSSGCA